MRKSTPKFCCNVVALVGAVLFAFLTLIPTDASAQNFCTSTGADALRSCRLNAIAEYWLAVGKCENLSDSAESASCKTEARQEMWAALGTCTEQNDARLDLCATLGPDAYDPQINPADFMTPAEIAANPNPDHPLVPGQVKVLEAETEDGTEHIEVTVTDDTKKILGIDCIVVRDTVTVDGELTEDTYDWYTQDKAGNVWYFGEQSYSYEGGLIVSLEGSWEADVDGAKPGIVMPATPKVENLYRQEFLLGEAEDMTEIVKLNEPVNTPYGPFSQCVVTRDFTPIHPDIVEYKYFAPGVGVVLEADFDSGQMTELVDLTNP